MVFFYCVNHGSSFITFLLASLRRLHPTRWQRPPHSAASFSALQLLSGQCERGPAQEDTPPDRGGPSASGAPFNPGTRTLRVTPRERPLPGGAPVRNFGWEKEHEAAAHSSRQRSVWVHRNHRNGSMAAQPHASGCARRGQRGQPDVSSSGIAGRDGLYQDPRQPPPRSARAGASPEKLHPLQPPPEPGEHAAGCPWPAGRDPSPQPGTSTCLQGTEPPPAPPLHPQPARLLLPVLPLRDPDNRPGDTLGLCWGASGPAGAPGFCLRHGG